MSFRFCEACLGDLDAGAARAECAECARDVHVACADGPVGPGWRCPVCRGEQPPEQRRRPILVRRVGDGGWRAFAKVAAAIGALGDVTEAALRIYLRLGHLLDMRRPTETPAGAPQRGLGIEVKRKKHSRWTYFPNQKAAAQAMKVSPTELCYLLQMAGKYEARYLGDDEATARVPKDVVVDWVPTPRPRKRARADDTAPRTKGPRPQAPRTPPKVAVDVGPSDERGAPAEAGTSESDDDDDDDLFAAAATSWGLDVAAPARKGKGTGKRRARA